MRGACQERPGATGACRALLLLVLFALLRLAAAQEASEDRSSKRLEAILAGVESSGAVGTGRALLAALNATAGSTANQLIAVTADITLTPADLQDYAHVLPIDGGNRTLVLVGASTAAGRRRPRLDWGGAVGVLHHPEGHTFVAYGLDIRGLAPASAGVAAGMPTQMVGCTLWPTITGAGGHLMALWNTTINIVSFGCTATATSFTVSALRQELGRSDTVAMLDDQTFEVNGPLDGSYAGRGMDTGDAAGNARFSWDNTTVACSRPEGGAPLPTLATRGEALEPVAAHQTSPTGVASSADELLFLLSSPNVTLIVLGEHIALTPASLRPYSLPLVLPGTRDVLVESNNDAAKVLDFGGVPRLLHLSAGSSLTFSWTRLQGAAPPSSAVANQSMFVAAPPLWPSIHGDPGHRLRFINGSLLTYTTPCSPSSVELKKELLRRDLGAAVVQDVGQAGYRIVPRLDMRVPMRAPVVREQGGVELVEGWAVTTATIHTFENTVVQCREDPGQGLAAAATQREQQAPVAVVRGGSGMPAWEVGVVAAAAASAVVLAALAAAALLLRLRRAAARPARSAADQQPPRAPAGNQVDLLESGDLTEKMGDVDTLQEVVLVLAGASSRDDTQGSVSPATSPNTPAAPGGRWRPSPADLRFPSADVLARKAQLCRRLSGSSKFGSVREIEIGEVLGRGAFGKVYKGRWQGAVVAVKVLEHRVAAGDPSALFREPLLCLAMAHPNCISIYHLSTLRLLRGEGLLDAEHGRPEGSSAAGGSPLRSLLSSTEAEEVADPSQPLQPGLYETWIVSEYCERGSLRDALARKHLVLPNGRPNMFHIYLCLLDVASGMQHLHTQGIVHSDLTPANVLLKISPASVRGYTCKLADFWLSRLLDGPAAYVKTGSLGTHTHAAPELLHAGRLSPAVDAFAFGVLAWELVAGEEAWRGQHMLQVAQQVMQYGARPPALPHCPPPLAALMARCWAEEPADRPHFAEVLVELQQQLSAVKAARHAALLPSDTAVEPGQR